MDVEPKSFKKAIKYYNLSKNTLSDSASKDKDAEPVYAVKLLLRDKSGNANQQLEVALFSWDGKGADFVPRVNLNSIEYSTLSAENELYEERVSGLIEGTSAETPVVITLEAPQGGKSSTFRVLKIN